METNERGRGDIFSLRDKYAAFLYRGGLTADAQEAAGSADIGAADDLLSALVPDGQGNYFFSDVDYGDANRNVWRTAAHLTRLEAALVRGGAQRFASDARFRARILGALRFWLAQDFTNPNWWHNEIGTPMHLGCVALMTADALTDDDRARLDAILARGSLIAGGTGNPRVAAWTGANLVWGAVNTVRRALLCGDDALLSAASARLAAELEYGREGIRPDGSFTQHGPRWYSGGYGASFTCELATLLWLFDGTPFMFPRRNLDIFLRHVLDGQRRMMLHGSFDPNGVGRELTRRSALRNPSLWAAIRLLTEVGDLPRQEELRDFLRDAGHALTEDDGEEPPSAAHFPAVSLLTHRARGVYIGVKGHAPGQYDAEVCNSEGELCYNMSYGTRITLMRRGDEYLDLCPIYDWAHVPGTTARQETDGELLAHRDWWRLPLPNGHTGGLAADGRGILFERPEHDGITLLASYFVFDGRLFALGAGITDAKSQTGCKPLSTTVDQCLPRDPEFSPDGQTASNGGFTYRNLGPGTAMTSGVTPRLGSWKRNSFEEPDEPVRGEIFLAEIPVTDASDGYAFSVSPRGEAPGAVILSNTAAVQAIRTDDGTVMAVFHTDGELPLPDGGVLRGRARECRILPPGGAAE